MMIWLVRWVVVMLTLLSLGLWSSLFPQRTSAALKACSLLWSEGRVRLTEATFPTEAW